MADLLSTTASLINLLDLCGKVLKYLRDVKDSPKDCARLMVEISSTRGILDTLRETVKDAETAPQDKWSATIRSLDKDGGPLKRLGEALTSLHGELYKAASARGLTKVAKRLLWPFKKEDAEKIIKIIDRQKLLLILALENDHVALSKEIHSDTRIIRAGMEAFKDNVDRLKWRQDDHDRRNILDWLTPIDYGTQQSDFISRRHEGTGKWLLNSDKFQAWLNTSNQTLFCPGIPGAGKTIITSIIVNNLYAKFQNDASVGIAYVYCNFRRQQEQKPSDLLASLLKQLIQEQPMPERIKILYERHKDKRTRPSVDEISKVLHSIVADYSRAFIVIDALDECQVSDGSRKRFLTELFDLQAKTGANFLATSRFIQETVKEFEGRSTQLEIRASGDDLQKYLDGHMLRLPSFVSRNADLQKEVKNAIINAVDGIFLLAQLYLDSLIGKRSPRAIRSALEKLPKGSRAYDHAYKEAMERIEGQVTDSQELAKQVLAWITCAERLLTTAELRHALAVEIGDSEFDEENVPEIEDIISVCAGLVTVDEKSHTVRLVHYTTQEFFERTQISWFPDAQRDIATTCVIYLSFNAFETGFCPTDEEFETRLQLYPFYDYAARNWGHHMRAASTEVEQLTLDLLDSETRVSGASQAMMALGGYPDYSQKVPRQITGVHLAAHFGLTKAIIALLNNGYDPDSIDTYDQTPLSWAAQNGQETVIKLLLLETDGVDPDSEDVCGRTPLSWAARYGHEAVVKFLLTMGGVDPDSRSDDYQTPLSLAAAHGHNAVMELLLTNNRVDINTKDTNGQTLLSRAAGNGHEAMVKLLLAKDGVDIDSKDRYGQTPLLLAAGNGHVAVVKLLLAKDVVDPDFKDNFDRTPLSWAARRGNSTVVKLLLEKYEEKGIIIRDKDVNITTSSTADDHPSIITCDICMFRIPDVDIHYHCGICSDGDFDICQECIASGIFCFNKFHKLVKRRVKDGTFVEVLD